MPCCFSSSIDLSKQIIEKRDSYPSSNVFISKSVLKDKIFEDAKEKEKNEINDILKIAHPHLKLPTLEDHFSMDLDNNTNKENENMSHENIDGEALNKSIPISEVSAPNLKFNKAQNEEQERNIYKKEKDFISDINTIEEQILNHHIQSNFLF